MKLTLLVLVASVTSSFAASTVNIRNFTSTTAGLPIVNDAGAAVAANSYHANAGIFTTPINFATATFTDIRSSFVSLDNTHLTTPSNRNGLFTGQVFNGTLPGGFAAQPAFIVVSNNVNFAEATLFAVFNNNVPFTAPDVAGNSSQQLDFVNPVNVVFGTVRSVTTQPSNLTNANFANGVVMVSQNIPEPSAALLGVFGALGLLRRRRN